VVSTVTVTGGPAAAQREDVSQHPVEAVALNDSRAKEWRRMAVVAVRLLGGVAAVGCFLGGLWSVWGDPGPGVGLLALGLVLGVVFGRYPRAAAAADAREDPDAG
jgi:hypothetical protein